MENKVYLKFDVGLHSYIQKSRVTFRIYLKFFTIIEELHYFF